MLIAKYRKAENPKEWFLTDFTMAQVEGRIELLEGDLSREIDHSRFLEKVLEAMLGEKFDKITLFEASKLRHAIISKTEQGSQVREGEMKPHKHERDKLCKCSPYMTEPHPNCPIHSDGDWPPRCVICGQFLPYIKNDKWRAK